MQWFKGLHSNLKTSKLFNFLHICKELELAGLCVEFGEFQTLLALFKSKTINNENVQLGNFRKTKQNVRKQTRNLNKMRTDKLMTLWWRQKLILQQKDSEIEYHKKKEQEISTWNTLQKQSNLNVKFQLSFSFSQKAHHFF